MRNGMLKIFFSIALLLFISSPLMAFAGQGQQRGHQGRGPEKKALSKLHLAIAKQDDLKLSDDQVAKIQKLMTETKKEVIQRKADIDLINIDIKSKLQEDPMDQKNIDKLIDQKYELKKVKAKTLVNACAELNNILSAEQKKQFKKICQAHESRPWAGHRGMGPSECGKMGQGMSGVSQ